MSENENLYDAVAKAVDAGNTAKAAVKYHAARMAYFLRGNLEACHDSDLKALKKELARYNIHTGKWKK